MTKIVRAPQRGETIVDNQGRATRKFISFLENLESEETASVSEQFIEEAIGNLAIDHAVLTRAAAQLEENRRYAFFVSGD